MRGLAEHVGGSGYFKQFIKITVFSAFVTKFGATYCT